MYQIMKIER